MIRSKWRDAVKNVTNDRGSGVGSDHFPLIVDVNARLRTKYWYCEERKKRYEYLKCCPREWSVYDDELDKVELQGVGDTEKRNYDNGESKHFAVCEVVEKRAKAYQGTMMKAQG